MSDSGSDVLAVIEGIVFDFDGLILDTEMPEYLTIKTAFDQHGVDLPLDAWLDVIGRADQRHWLDWLEDELGTPIDREVVHARRQAEHHALIRQQEVLPGVVHVLDQAAALGVPATVASSSSRAWVTGHLDRLGLAPSFVGVFTREDVEHAKPWPDLFLAAVAAMGVDAACTVAFEDSYHGSQAAKRAGLFCVAVPNELTRSQDFSHCDRVVHSLAEVDLGALVGRHLGPPNLTR